MTKLALVLFLGLLPGLASAQAKTRLVVYSTLENDYIETFRRAFERDHPEIELSFHRDATGVVTAKLLAEKSQPRADAIWGLAVTSMLLLDREGLLVPHVPPNLTEFKPNFRDPNTPPSWFGMEAWAASLCFNTVEAKKLGLPVPKSWYDLLDPRFKGRLVMPNPTSSGTGFFHVSGWIQMFGEAEAWRFMDRLHDNIAVYVHSGSKPCRDAAAGEYPVGIAYDLLGATLKTAGAPIEILVMTEGGGWDMDAFAIVKGTAKLAAARRLADWAASRKANEAYAKYASQVALPGIPNTLPNYPPEVEASLIKNDFAWASANRARILAEWQKRYELKTEKRK
ncbi:MAG: putative 2-aminoethylphosphonate ABC transporter substrate-binding protein [Alphaproteobacteria bacterium]|nr:putative 2-aminoethylphosphonate ABC transporter substrate-binding protein [Alphaproteobacteria bacterium]